MSNRLEFLIPASMCKKMFYHFRAGKNFDLHKGLDSGNLYMKFRDGTKAHAAYFERVKDTGAYRVEVLDWEFAYLFDEFAKES